MTFNMHLIKRQARREAWDSDSWGPFRKTSRSKTWAPNTPNGEEERGETLVDRESLKVQGRLEKNLSAKSNPNIEGGEVDASTIRQSPHIVKGGDLEMDSIKNVDSGSSIFKGGTSTTSSVTIQDVNNTLSPDHGTEADFEEEANIFAFSLEHLNKLLNPKSLAAIFALGGHTGLERGLRSDIHTGLSVDEAKLGGVVSFGDVTRYNNLQDSEDKSSPSSAGAESGGGLFPVDGRHTVGYGEAERQASPQFRSESEEQKARNKLLGRFRKRGWYDEPTRPVDDDTPKKRPWYKGKVLQHREPFPFANQMFNSWVNILLLASPVGVALNYTEVDKRAVFVANPIAIIPLAALLSFATEDIALRVGGTLASLLNVTIGSTVIQFAFSALTLNISNAVVIAAGLAAIAAGDFVDVGFELIHDELSASANLAGAALLIMGYGCYLLFRVNSLEDKFEMDKSKVPPRFFKKSGPQKFVSKSVATNGSDISTRERLTVQFQSRRRSGAQMPNFPNALGGLLSSHLVTGVSAAPLPATESAGNVARFWDSLLTKLERVALDCAAPVILVVFSCLVCVFCWYKRSRWTIMAFWAVTGAIYTLNQKDTKVMVTPADPEDHPELLFGVCICWLIFTGTAFIQARDELTFGKIFTVLTVLIGFLFEIIIHNSPPVSSIWEQFTGRSPTIDITFPPSIIVSFTLLEVYEYSRNKLYQPDETLPRGSQHRVPGQSTSAAGNSTGTDVCLNF